jgi:hypothetical protein
MLVIEPDMLSLVFLIVLALFGVNTIRATYWKAKYHELEDAYKNYRRDNSSDGWIEEVRFLRRQVNKNAAIAIEKQIEDGLY